MLVLRTLCITLFSYCLLNEVEVAFVEDVVWRWQMMSVFGNLQTMYSRKLPGCRMWLSIKFVGGMIRSQTSHQATSGCESCHAHLNADFYSAQPNINFAYLSRRYCDNMHPRRRPIFLWRHIRSHGQFSRTAERSPHFCDACTLTPRRTSVQKTVLAACIIPILSASMFYSLSHDVDFKNSFLTDCFYFASVCALS